MGARAAIGGEEDARPIGYCGIYPCVGKIVAIPNAVGNEGRGSSAQLANDAYEERRRGHAVHVVVAVDHDALAGGDRPRYALDGIAHAVHGRAVMQLVEPGAQESLGAVDLDKAAARE